MKFLMLSLLLSSFSSFVGPNIRLRILFWSLHSYLNLRNHVSQPYSTTEKSVLYILIFSIIDQTHLGRSFLEDFGRPLENTIGIIGKNTVGGFFDLLGIRLSKPTNMGQAIANKTTEYFKSWWVPEFVSGIVGTGASVVSDRLTKTAIESVGQFIKPLEKLGLLESLMKVFTGAVDKQN